MTYRPLIQPEILRDAAERSLRYLSELPERAVAPAEAAVRRLSELEEPLPDGPSDPAEVLAMLDDIGSPATVAGAAGRYFGFVVGGSLPAALAAHWLAGAWDQNVVMKILSPAGAALQSVAGRWILELLGLPSQSHVSFVTGTTMANATGLAAGRHAVLRRAGWDVEANGLFGAPEVTVVVGEEAHATVYRALGLLGLGKARVVTVPVDRQGRFRADRLPALGGPTIICLQAGNVDTGAFDPFAEVCAVAREVGAWIHIDGAFGLWAAASDARAQLVAGVAAADSWATDGHKWLNVPYDCGLAIVRDRNTLRRALSFKAEYMVHDERGDPMDFTPEASQRARAVEVWAALRSLGRSGVEDLVERTCRHAERFAAGLAEAGYEILNDVCLNQVLVSFGAPETTRRIIAAIQADGTCWCGGTIWQGRTAMRISVSSWATDTDDVDRSLDAIVRIAAESGAVAGRHRQ